MDYQANGMGMELSSKMSNLYLDTTQEYRPSFWEMLGAAGKKCIRPVVYIAGGIVTTILLAGCANMENYDVRKHALFVPQANQRVIGENPTAVHLPHSKGAKKIEITDPGPFEISPYPGHEDILVVRYKDIENFQGTHQIIYKVTDADGISEERAINIIPDKNADDEDKWNLTIQTDGIGGYLLYDPDGRRLRPKAGGIYVIGNNLLDPHQLKLDAKGWKIEAEFDWQVAWQNYWAEFGDGSVMLYRDPTGVLYGFPAQKKGDFVRGLGNQLKWLSLSIPSGAEAVLQNPNGKAKDAEWFAGFSDFNKGFLFKASDSFPVVGAGWRRVHSPVNMEGQLSWPIFTYLNAPKYIMTAEQASKIDWKHPWNPEPINLDYLPINTNRDKTSTIIGAGGWDTGVIFLSVRGGGNGEDKAISPVGPGPGENPGDAPIDPF